MVLNNFQKVFIIIKHSYIIKYLFKDLNMQVYQIFLFQTFFYVESSVLNHVKISKPFYSFILLLYKVNA